MCSDRRRMSFGIMVTFTMDGRTVSEDEGFVSATGRWAANTEYLHSACVDGICMYMGEVINSREVNLASPCVRVQRSRSKGYLVIIGCPILEASVRNCVKMDDGNETAPYPYCCPRYMCPPRGREQRSKVVTETVPVDDGHCNYHGSRFSTAVMASSPCHSLTCYPDTGSVIAQVCLDAKDLSWNGCIEVTEAQPSKGFVPLCCPDLICPDMTVEEALREPNYYDVLAVVDACRYEDRYFRKAWQPDGKCELWTCLAPRRQVKVTRCQSIQEELGPNCAWEVKDPNARFPECCAKKVCRWYFSTYFPGTLLESSPLPKVS
ncbi:uncharacterized protein LOC119390467 isoform X3 [Rhipicephalus sanguineus]|uniref:uncharacterized protein LOC119390467 isoform X3 n=1 Tax=Rhipicephalus sanguineus TaxID=34632 RepID=UPI0020C4F2E2|nr:uncharacterized protein LOC119390467 isoform X3 [Rhipicephalus sanguineus]